MPSVNVSTKAGQDHAFLKGRSELDGYDLFTLLTYRGPDRLPKCGLPSRPPTAAPPDQRDRERTHVDVQGRAGGLAGK